MALILKPSKVFFYDTCQDEPHASSSDWGTSKKKGWAYFSGGDHNSDNKNQNATLRVVKKGFENAPDGRLGPGTASYRMQVIKRTDYPPCCEWTRSELYWGTAAEFTDCQWQALSMFIPSDWVDDNRPVGLGFDNKFANAQGPASFYLKIENGQYQINRQYPQGAAEVRTNVGAIQKGVWVDMVLHRNYKNDASGFMEFYINKKKVWEHKGANYMMDNGPQTEGYVLHGIYKWSYSSPNGQGEGSGSYNGPITIYLAEIKFGDSTATLDEVSPQGTTTLPPPIEPPTQPPSVESIQINVGGPAFSATWVADKYFTGGSLYAVTSPIANTVDDAIYQNERYGNFTYNIPIKNGTYTVKLHFAEIFHKAAGLRVFNVAIQDKSAHASVDIFAEAGANTALIKTSQAVVTNGILKILFATVKDNASVCAIEVIPGAVVPPPPVDTTIYIKSFTQGTKTVNGIIRPVIIITWTDNTTVTIDHK